VLYVYYNDIPPDRWRNPEIIPELFKNIQPQGAQKPQLVP
jgi:hypothetical protein